MGGINRTFGKINSNKKKFFPNIAIKFYTKSKPSALRWLTKLMLTHILVLFLSVRTKINNKFSLWKELSQGVPQGHVLGPLLSNIYLNDLLFLSEFTGLCNFADGTTFYSCDMDLNSLIKKLEHDNFLTIEWFVENNMKLNQDKCHLLVSGYKNEMLELI